MNKFGEFLLIPHGQDLVDLLFYSIRFAVRFLKSKKPIGVMITKLRKHSGLTSVISCVMRNIFCSLILTIKNVRNSALELTKYYQSTEQKKKFYSLLTKNSEKPSMIRKLSSCVTKKLNGFHIVALEYGKKLRKRN